MKTRQLNAFIISLGILSGLFLAFLFFSTPIQNTNPLEWLLFLVLILYTSIFSIPLKVGEVSLMPTVALTSIMLLGPVPTAVLELCTDVILGFLRWLIPQKIGWQPEKNGLSLPASSAANFTMHMVSILAAGSFFYSLGGQIPIQDLRSGAVAFGTVLVYIIANYLFAGMLLYLRSQAYAKYLVKHLGPMLMVELLPMLFAPFAIHIYSDMGIFSFTIFAVTLMTLGYILRSQMLTQNALKRRIQELAGLQAVGQTLSTSLDLNQVLESIYHEVSKLMPTVNFFVALYHPDTDEVSFPLAYDRGKKVSWTTRAAGKGVTEYILTTQKPLLMENNVKATIESFGLTQYGEEAISWLGVPILAGDQSLGVIAVQSYTLPNQIPQLFDQSHQVILSTIADQASVAIQNARLYAQTDQALNQKLLELNSILDTTSEGLVLLDRSLKILEVNRAVCKMLETSPSNLIGKSAREEDTTPHKALMIGKKVRQALIDKEISSHLEEIILSGTKEIPVERSITPVVNITGEINGWLLVFRDLTEEIQLANFRQDLTRMLVHDLRSPIVTIQGGLDMIEILLDDGELETIPEMINISRSGSEKMLGMINELLNINQLETGELKLQIESVSLPDMYQELSSQFSSVVQKADLSLTTEFAPDLPAISADASLLKRVIHNLLDNAVKFTPNGGKIKLGAKRSPGDPDKIWIVVCDTGPGIPSEQQKQIFNKNVTYHTAHARRRGSGLGLYFCKLAVTAHQGDIRVISEEGKGSCFTVELPVTQA